MTEHVHDASGNGSIAQRAMQIMEQLEKEKRLSFIDIPPEVYHATHAISHSQLKNMKDSPAKFKWELENVREAGPAQELGTAVHMAILEPERFDNTYAEMPKVDRRTKVGKEVAAKFEEDNKGKLFLSASDMGTVNKIHQRINGKDWFKQFLGVGEKEKSFFVKDEETKLYLRCRPDNVLDGGAYVVDLKTTDCARKDVFMKDITNYNYWTQGAFYSHMVEMATGKRPEAFIIVAVEKSRDCDSNIFVLKPEAIDLGIKLCRAWLRRLAECIAKDEWPGYDNDFIEYDVPEWLARSIEL